MERASKAEATQRQNRSKLKNDVIFIAALLTVVILAGLGFSFLRANGDRVTVTVNGELYGVYRLDEDAEVEIRTGENGEELNYLVIREGRAYIETATCPDGICASHKPIFRIGESIVCLPHQIVITVAGADREAQPDLVV
jgi:hypothetical protein